VRFNYTVADGALSYAPVNPSDLPDEDGADFMEDALDFARLKIAGNTKQVKACKKGYACGYTCISQNRNCRKPLPGQAKTAAEWVAQQKGLDKPTLPQDVAEIRDFLAPMEDWRRASLLTQVLGQKVKESTDRVRKEREMQTGKKRAYLMADVDLTPQDEDIIDKLEPAIRQLSPEQKMNTLRQMLGGTYPGKSFASLSEPARLDMMRSVAQQVKEGAISETEVNKGDGRVNVFGTSNPRTVQADQDGSAAAKFLVPGSEDRFIQAFMALDPGSPAR
jgi:hypothetical protein